MINRNQIFKWYIQEFKEYADYKTLVNIFMSSTDNQLAKQYGFRVLRTGFFIR